MFHPVKLTPRPPPSTEIDSNQTEKQVAQTKSTQEIMPSDKNPKKSSSAGRGGKESRAARGKPGRRKSEAEMEMSSEEDFPELPELPSESEIEMQIE